MPKERPGDFNQALMDLGSSICIPNGEPFVRIAHGRPSVRRTNMDGKQNFPSEGEKEKEKIEKRLYS